MERISEDTKAVLKSAFGTDEARANLFFNTKIGIVIFEAFEKMKAVNNAFCEMVGYSRHELFKMRLKELVPSETYKWIYNYVIPGAFRRGYSDLIRKTLIAKGGRRVFVEGRIYVVNDDCLIVKYRDITEERVKEAEFLRAVNLHNIDLPDNVNASEREVAKLVADGLGSKEIADRINLTKQTVDNYRGSLRKKLGVPKLMSLREHLKDYLL